MLEFGGIKHKLSDHYISKEEINDFNANDLSETFLSKKNSVPLQQNIREEYYNKITYNYNK